MVRSHPLLSLKDDEQVLPSPRDYLWVPASAVYCCGFALGVQPVAWRLLKGQVQGLLAVAAAADAVFAACALLFLWAGLKYAAQRHPRGLQPYRGAWLLPSGRLAWPWGLSPWYLALALAQAGVLPAAALALCAVDGWPSARLGATLLAPYLALFALQAALETRLCNRNVMSPTIPLLFAPYRWWQLARGLWLLRLLGAGAAPAGRLGLPLGAALPALLLHLLLFWSFDTGFVLVSLPWTYCWQLQAPPTRGRSKGG